MWVTYWYGRQSAAVVNITDFQSHTFLSSYNVCGLCFTIFEKYREDLTQAQFIGGSFEIVIITEHDERQRIQTVHFKKSPCSLPCKYLQLNRRILDSIEGSGQTHCNLCNPYPIIRDSYIQPSYNTCMEIRTRGTSCENVTSLVEIKFSKHYTIQVTFDGNIDLYFNDMYSNFYTNTDEYDADCDICEIFKFIIASPSLSHSVLWKTVCLQKGSFFILHWFLEDLARNWTFLYSTRPTNGHCQQHRRTMRVGTIC